MDSIESIISDVGNSTDKRTTNHGCECRWQGAGWGRWFSRSCAGERQGYPSLGGRWLLPCFIWQENALQQCRYKRIWNGLIFNLAGCANRICEAAWPVGMYLEESCALHLVGTLLVHKYLLLVTRTHLLEHHWRPVSDLVLWRESLSCTWLYQELLMLSTD